MCVAMAGIIEDSRLEGRREGMLKGRKEGVLEGRKEGILEGRESLFRELVAKGIIGADQILQAEKLVRIKD